METSGLDLTTWLTLLGVVIVFFVLPATYLEVERRKRLRKGRR
jgi:hypothetical protein